MAMQKACKACKAIYEGNPCPQCGANEPVESFKGKVAVVNPEQSEIATNLKIKKKGSYAIKLG
ncbi:hypothetical protein HYZ97_02320 [Candidatus Pacearchaeota archaeon]|nr:hypothetical protein [Candidatus Pacearchaeota archaeon]